MNDQYDKAYEQFKIVEDETEAEEKLAKLLDKLGKEKPDQYFAKDSNSGRTREKSEDKKQAVVRLKIEDNTSKSFLEADILAQKVKSQEKEDIKAWQNFMISLSLIKAPSGRPPPNAFAVHRMSG